MLYSVWEGTGVVNADKFESFFVENEPAIRRALAARFGNEIGRDSTAEAFAVAWCTWDRVADMKNPAGYVYRIADRWALRQTRRESPATINEEAVEDSYRDPELAAAVKQLSPRQREAVVLVKGLGMTYQEAAELIGCSRSSLQKHVERGLSSLRKTLEVNESAQ